MSETVNVIPASIFSGKVAVGNQPEGNLPAETIHVLLVDDERLSRLVVGNLLRKCKYKVTAVATGMEALEVLRTNGAGTFQLVLTDVMMPDVDGIELLKHVRQDDSLSSVPVVMMSANEHPDTVFECIRAGAEDYLLKPLTKKEVQYIWQHVWRRKHQPALRVPPQPVQEPAQDQAETSAEPQTSGSHAMVQQPAQLAVQAEGAAQHQQQVAGISLAHSDAQSPHASAAVGAVAFQREQQQAASPPSDVISVSRYLSLSQSNLSTENGFRIFCAVLALLQPAHAQGIPVQSIRPSQLLLHRSGQVSIQDDLPVSVREAELYASPEELVTGCRTPASDIFSVGMLFFELLNPVQDAQVRSRVLAEVRRRVLPASLGQHRPHETAILLALLHPEASKRPTVAQIIGSNLLNMLRSSVHQQAPVQAGPSIAHQQQMLAQQQRLAEEQHRCHQYACQQEQSAQASQPAQQQRQVSPLAGVDSETLLDFLSHMRQSTVTAVDNTQHQMAFLDRDIQEVNTAMLVLQCQHGIAADSTTGDLLQSSSAPSVLQSASPQPPLQLQHPASRKRQRSWELDSAESPLSDSIAVATQAAGQLSQAAFKRERIQQSCCNVDRAFDELERKFFQQRQLPARDASTGSPDLSDSSHVDLPGVANLSDHLADFSTDLIDFSRYNQLKVKAELNYSDLLTVTDMVCSTAFDRDDEFFATAGVFRRVKIFDFASVQDSDTSIHYPVLEIPSRSKLSSVCWNSYVKSNLICSDYEGVVQLWDVSQQTETMTFEEHAKRVWSVDFSHTDPTRFLSGSDDGTVRLWSIADESAVACIDSKANVCSVQFSPTNSNLMAFGSANYRVYLYDLRHIAAPLAVIGGHTKAVSYVRWVGSSQVISASTDNTLKLWDVADAASSEGDCAPITSFTGHTNEKNFVGLSVSQGGHVACGSENNAVYCYHKAVSTPICYHKFGTPGQHEDPSEAHQFVSSVCWSRKSNTMISANSMGNIKVLELV